MGKSGAFVLAISLLGCATAKPVVPEASPCRDLAGEERALWIRVTEESVRNSSVAEDWTGAVAGLKHGLDLLGSEHAEEVLAATRLIRLYERRREWAAKADTDVPAARALLIDLLNPQESGAETAREMSDLRIQRLLRTLRQADPTLRGLFEAGKVEFSLEESKDIEPTETALLYNALFEGLRDVGLDATNLRSGSRFVCAVTLKNERTLLEVAGRGLPPMASFRAVVGGTWRDSKDEILMTVGSSASGLHFEPSLARAEAIQALRFNIARDLLLSWMGRHPAVEATSSSSPPSPRSPPASP